LGGLTPSFFKNDEYQIRENNAAYNTHFAPKMEALRAKNSYSWF